MKGSGSAVICKNIHNCQMLSVRTLTCHFISYTWYYCVGPPFGFRAASTPCGIDSTSCWKSSSEILAHIDTTASHTADLSATCPWCESPLRSLWLWKSVEDSDLNAMFKKPVWLIWAFLTYPVILLEAAIRRWVHCAHKRIKGWTRCGL